MSQIKKNPNVDNEKLRIPLIFLGFFITASIITLSFSYKEPAMLSELDRAAQAKDDVPEELELIEEPEEDEPEDVPEPEEIEDLEITPEPTDDDIKTVESEDKNIKVEITVPKIEIEEPKNAPAPEAPIIDFPDKEAEFPGGTAAMKQYLAENVKYPEISMELRDQGRVFVEFVINKDGSIEQVKVVKGVSKELDAEAVRVVRSMPKWVPAESGGEAVRARARIPINFILY